MCCQADRNELSEDDYDEDEDEDEEEEILYNPKNVPLGWDGKPIPYWLYKLHGLNIEFPCEICGNYSYWGRKYCAITTIASINTRCQQEHLTGTSPNGAT